MFEFQQYLKEAEDDFLRKDYSEALAKCVDLIKEDATPLSTKIEAQVLQIKVLTHMNRYDEALSKFIACPTKSWNPITRLKIMSLYDSFYNKAVEFYEKKDYRMARLMIQSCLAKVEPIFGFIPIQAKKKLEELRLLIRWMDKDSKKE